LWALALVLWAGVVAVVWVENPGSSAASQQPNVPDAGPVGDAPQTPASDASAPAPLPQNPLPGSVPPAAASQNPVPDAGTTGQAACIEETGDYQTRRHSISFVIGLENKCDKRLKCQIFANVTGAKGTSLGHTTLILGAKLQGQPAKKSYAMKVKAAGGVAQVSRECRVL
jgi:hypothetical protein